MEIEIQVLNQHNLCDVEKCDGTFLVDTKLIVNANNGVIQFDKVPVAPYQKRYPLESIDYDSYLTNTDRVIFLAYIENKIAGQLRMGRSWNQYAYIEDLVVDIKFRRCGVGRRLIQQAITWAKDKQLVGVMLETQNNNVNACLLYQHCGFEVGGFDRLLYQAELPGTEEVALFWYLVFKS